jgi:hypothetical protein
VQNDEVEVASFPDSKAATSWAVDLSVLLKTLQDRTPAVLHLHSKFTSFYMLAFKICLLPCPYLHLSSQCFVFN